MASYRHDTNELAWASEGRLALTIEGAQWLISPEQAVWIPAGVSHRVPSTRKAIVFPLHFDASEPGPGWTEATAVWVGPELRMQLMRYIQSTFGEGTSQQKEGTALLDMLPAHGQPEPPLPIPVDPRAEYVAQKLLADPRDNRGIEEWAAEVGTSGKTLQRAFVASTGLRFSEWRLRARLDTSLRLLAQGVPVSEIAPQVGYTSVTGFIAAFRRHYGHSPTAHWRAESASVPDPV